MVIDNNIEEKDIIVTQVIDEFIKRKRSGEKPTIEEYMKKYPEYAEEIEKELEEELSWSAQFHMPKEIPPIVSIKEESNRSWERFHTRVIWGEKTTSPVCILTGTIEARISKTFKKIKILIPDILTHILTPKEVGFAMLGEDRTKEELEIPIPDIKGILKISIFPPDKGTIQVNVQPTIKEARFAQLIIPVIIKDRLRDTMVERIPVHSGKIVQFELSPDKDYSIYIQVGKEKRTYEVPLKISKSKENELTALNG